MRYETSFPGSEDPISEGGVWLGAGGFPNNNRLKKVSGIACGIAVGTAPPWDPQAYVTGFASNGQRVDATVFVDPAMGNCQHELEILLRTSDNGTYIRAYEVNCQFGQALIGALVLYRWNGDGSADALPGGGSIVQNGGVFASGDLFSASVTGDTVSIYWNNILQYQITDSSPQKISTGAGCGLAVFRRDTANGGCDDTFDTSTGFTHFVADDGLGKVLLGQGAL